MERRLAAILAADVVGYTRLMGEDETGTLAALKAHRKELIDPKAAQYNGRTIKLMGDGALMEFPSVIEAVTFAVEVQLAMRTRNADVPDDKQILLRIGINIGDVIIDGDDIYGDGVNLAARLEGLAEPGGVCVRRAVRNQVRDKIDLEFEDRGEIEVKNVARPVRVFAVVLNETAQALVTPVEAIPEPKAQRRWPAIAAGATIVLITIAGIAWWQPWAPHVEPASIERFAYPLPEKPSVAVLPFDNLSGDPKQSHLVDGITESIITELSRFRGLFVIARNSVLDYRDKPVKVRLVAEELGVQYVLEGSVQRSADQIRVTAQLIDAVAGTQLWAERYDREMSDIFAVQDEVTERIVASLGAYQGELAEAAKERAKRKDPASLSAYEALLLGIEHKHRFTEDDNATAQAWFNKAIDLDPQFSQAYVGLAWIHIQQFWFGWANDPEQAVARTREAALKAIEFDPSEAEAHWMLAEAYLADSQFEQGEAAYEKALALNPNHADLLAGWGYASVLLGQPVRGVDFLKKAMRLNPHYPDWYDRGLGTAAYMSGRYDDAITAFRKITQHVIQSRLYLAASYVRLGRLEEARAEVAEAIALDADISVEKFGSIELYKNPADLERLRTDLRNAGLPEHAPLKLPSKPSIAVLAFDNLSGDLKQDYFAEAIAENITAELSRFGGLFVISRNSAFTYKDKSLTAKSIGRELGVRYVLEGSVQKGRDRMRVTVQLIDAAEDAHVWAETYDRPLEDIFMVQDEITKRIVSTLGETIWQSAARSLDRKPLKDFTAYDFVLRGMEHLHRFTPADNIEARRLYTKARDLDPSIFQAHIGLGWTYFLDWLYRLGDTPDALERALTHAQKAAEVEPNNGGAPRLLARIHLAWGNFDQALALSERAVTLSPNTSDILVNHGLILAYLGQPGESVGWSEKAVRLNPHHPSWYRSVLALGQYLDERYEEAVKTLASNSKPDLVRPVLPAAYVRLGRLEDARRHAQAILDANPGYNLRDLAKQQSFQNPADLRRYLEDLRAAGLPD